VQRAHETGLRAGDFWRPSFGALWAVLVELAERDMDVSPVSVAHELERRTRAALAPLDELVGVDGAHALRVLERLAHEPRSYVTQAVRLAELVHEAGRDRDSIARLGSQPERSAPGSGGRT
jgi:hypothetical protein